MSESNFLYPLNIYNSRSAQVILPLIFRKTNVKSILDVGCGIGTWLKIALQEGLDDVLGIDIGTTQDLIVESKYFKDRDLQKPINLERKYDLAICLEVAEHLPENKSSTLIESLVTHSDLILFSAAIPGQGGAGHVNEQWGSYWQAKFETYGYYFSDYLRPKIWNNIEVDLWYKQNCVLVVKRNSKMSEIFPETSNYRDLIHPDLYTFILSQAKRMGLFEQGKGSLKLLVRYFFMTLTGKCKK